LVLQPTLSPPANTMKRNLCFEVRGASALISVFYIWGLTERTDRGRHLPIRIRVV
jgi:hypothetical protein